MSDHPPILTGIDAERRSPVLSGLTNPLLAAARPSSPSNTGDTTSFRYVRVVLHGIYAEHHFDGGPNGPTGEWFFTSLITDGSNIVGVTSKQVEGHGIFNKITAGSWIDTEDLLLWPRPDKYSERVPEDARAAGNLKVQFSVLEDDDSAIAQGILNDVENVSKAWLVQEGANPATLATADALLSSARRIVEIYANDDKPISSTFGLDQDVNYRIGHFLRVNGDRSRAFLSVRPVAPANKNLYALESKTLRPYEQAELSLNVETPAKENSRLVAILVRPHVPYGNLGRTQVQVLNNQVGTTNQPLFITRSPAAHHVPIEGGSGPVRLRMSTVAGAEVHVMVTACSPTGAVEHSGELLIGR
jgi:hypothetical protein